ncbi:P44/Msp2 family outer membrane protein [Candidatus Anaplasma sp. TIGMIC]|uniref:P44/Msp2 family outer membrane protein n=1 Tax=Candidatus Anaplasma sp. TIGMIC TaxID=3020713 RepID=UPI002330E7D4|nr:P44/Msp2 family outer membrane protein [Candidatus Anaplasma sp. TIGMIC]MDB1135512.1 P44/Msp2 family outer membrane protein [Candidatus Anaplasma sp. TIGMIC]
MKLIEKVMRQKSVAEVVVFFMVLFVPFQAFSYSATYNAQQKDVKSSNRLYFSGAYRSSFPNFGSLEVEESSTYVPNKGTVQKMSMKGGVIVDINDPHSFGPYREALYENNYYGYAGSIGYSIGAFRIELEGVRNEFKVRGSSGSIHEDDPSYIALVRSEYVSKANYVVVKNKKVAVSSVVFNVCYDIKAKADPIVSYLCFGVSGNAIDILETRKMSHGYYGKMGVGVVVTDDVVLSVGGYYHMIHNNNFHGIKVMVPSAAAMQPLPNTAHAKMSIAYLGGEVSLRYSF